MPVPNMGPKPMNQRERLFVEAYCTQANFHGKKAAVLAGYAASNAERQAAMLLERPNIAQAIRTKIDNKKKGFRITEEQIVGKLWEEANYMGKGTSHAARINALVWLGKHIAMWQDKREQGYTGDTYNIVQYSETPKIKQAIEEHKEEVEEQQNVDLPEGVLLTKFGD